VSEYRGYTIALLAGQQDDDKWVCRYSILTRGNVGMGSTSRYVEGSFSSQVQAETAALTEAKAVIDGY
jgi:hypothetical protein